MDPTLRLLTRALAVTALTLLSCATGLALFVDLGHLGQLNPIRSTFSELIFTEQGARLVGVCLLAAASGSLALAGALVGAAAPGCRSAAWLLVVWAAGLLLAAVFPMEPVHEPITLYGAVHRYSAALGFLALPVAGLLLATRFRGDPRWGRLSTPLRVLAWAGLTGVGAFLATFVPVDRPLWLLGERGYSGAAERLLLAAHVVLLVVLTWRVLRHSARPAPSPPREPLPVRGEPVVGSTVDG
ncbi:hypothetical protein JOF53_003338 [Crossiella equi]|uniref:DUF998 domain-containing protein n=1 Tax=Crossiella equi TaxID=130796 RepID=A0ABS5AD11_9PSEU|nr:DUF998 domain-containing protein [Crossiella equi]MBP2474466.1 hypothetical protein [Crossiella equi]